VAAEGGERGMQSEEENVASTVYMSLPAGSIALPQGVHSGEARADHARWDEALHRTAPHTAEAVPHVPRGFAPAHNKGRTLAYYSAEPQPF
jgi:hypothetical protein